MMLIFILHRTTKNIEIGMPYAYKYILILYVCTYIY